jgi:ABC-type amino acid transport substrate-binding protein
MSRFVRLFFGALVALPLLLTGCSSLSGPTSNALRVGITPDYPPLAFMRDGYYVGLEADLAVRLGKELGRPVTFRQFRWENQIDELTAGNTDIIMCGMSVTTARQLRVAFSDSYLRNGLVALTLKANAAAFSSADKIRSSGAVIGVREGATSEVFVKAQCPGAKCVQLATAADAAFYLKNRRIDAFVGDVYAVVDLYAKNEADFAVSPEPLTAEPLAWAVRTTDPQLLADVNAVLARWRADGSLDAAIRQWVPYIDRVRQVIPAR